MTKLLEHAVETVRGLPAEVQDDLARTLLQLAEADQPAIRLTVEERADLVEADAEIARGELATDAEIRALGSSRFREAPLHQARDPADRRNHRRHRAESPQGARRVRERMKSVTTLLSSIRYWTADRSCGRPADAGQPLSLPYFLSRYRGRRDRPACASCRARTFGRSAPSLNEIGGPACQSAEAIPYGCTFSAAAGIARVRK